MDQVGKQPVTLTDKEADKLYRGTFGEQLAYKGGDLDANWPIWRKSGGGVIRAREVPPSWLPGVDPALMRNSPVDVGLPALVAVVQVPQEAALALSP
jgi:hypothetical protein